jgi:ABC-2 type transport system ATP-binding protein
MSMRSYSSDISVRGLTKRFGRVTAVDDLTFDVPSGQVTGFLGPNGAGKTTTLRMLLGLVRPTAGEALIGGLRYADLDKRTERVADVTHPASRTVRPRQVVGAVLEVAGGHPGRTGRGHLGLHASAAGADGRNGLSRVDEVLDRVGLTGAAERRIRTYSLGMRQRLGLATALLGDPAVLLLDEPANGLDPAGIAWLRGLMRDLAAEGRTVLVSSHVLSEVAQIADRVVIVTEGRLRYGGPVSELGGPDALESAFLQLTGAAS